MKIYNITNNIDKLLDDIIKILNNDGVIVYPTDTIYGFGSNVFSEKSINKIKKIKNRKSETPFSICVPSKEYLFDKVILNDKIIKIVNEFLPGAVTLILPTKKDVLPKYLYSDDIYVGYRIPNNKLCLKLIKKYNNPIVSTSINLSGNVPMNNINEIIRKFSNRVDIYIKDDNLEKENNPIGSTIIKISENNNIALIRQGNISFSDILKIID